MDPFGYPATTPVRHQLDSVNYNHPWLHRYSIPSLQLQLQICLHDFPCTATTTIKDATVTANATNATNIIVPRLAGNLPLITHHCAERYRLYPKNRMRILIPRNVAPSGFPRCRKLSAWSPSSANDVLRRKSCAIAIPIEAKASDVRSHARNVRSENDISLALTQQPRRTAQHT
jgi:hypothetical protein